MAFCKGKVAIYVPQRYLKKIRRSFNVRSWRGVMLLKHQLELAGIPVGYCCAETVTSYDVILVSLVADSDWFPFISERVTWAAGEYTVLIGGPGVCNLHFCREYADAFVFGRAEDIIVPLVQEALLGERYRDSSICWSDEFDAAKRYEVRQATQLYPHAFCGADNTTMQEAMIGCNYKCLYCAYSWMRQYRTAPRDTGSLLRRWTWGTSLEMTLLDLDTSDPDVWNTHPTGAQQSLLVVGVDGSSERLRRLCNKPILHDHIQRFMLAAIQRKVFFVAHLFNLVGLPTETADDRAELIRTFQGIAKMPIPAKAAQGRAHRKAPFGFDLRSNHLLATPCTPFAPLPVHYQDLQRCFAPISGYPKPGFPTVLACNDTFEVIESYGADCLAVVILRHLLLRATETDTELIRKIAINRKFWNARAGQKLVTVEKYVDVTRICGAYHWSELPTAYIHTYIATETMAKMLDIRLRRYGNSAGVALADYISGSTDTRPPIVGLEAPAT